MSEESKPLNKKHQRFVDEYLKCFNATQAYLRVYPNSTRDAARANAARLLATDNIKAEVQGRLDEAHMSADEALKLLADIGRGDIGELLDNNGLLDIRLAKSSGKTKLLRKIKQKTITRIGKKEDDDDMEITEIEFEMYPADSAIERVLKVHGKLTQKVDLTSGGEPLKPPQIIEVVRTIKDDDDKPA